LIVSWCGQFLFFVVPLQFSQDVSQWPENQILIPETHLMFSITNLPSNYICAGMNYDGTSFVVPIDAASEVLVSYNINSCYEQSIIFGYPMAVNQFDIMLSTISSETNTPSYQVTLDDWTVILEVESIEGIPYQTKFS